MKHFFVKNLAFSLLIILCLIPPALAAETPVERTTPQELNLEGVMRLAAEQSIDVLSANQGKEEAKGRIREAYANAMPLLSAGADWRYVSDSISRGENEQTTVSMNLAQPLYRGGSISAGIRAAKLYDKYSSQSVDSAKLEVVRLACIRYYDVLFAKADVQVAQETLDLSSYNLDVVTGRKAQGTATNLDVIRAKEQLSNNQADLLTAQNRLSIARMRLMTVLRLSPGSPIKIQGDLSFTPDSQGIQDPVKVAEDRRPDLQVLKTQVSMQNESIIATKAERWLTADLVGAYNQVTPESPMDDGWVDEYYGGVTLSIPIFEGRRTSGKVAQEKAIQRQYEYAVEQKTDDIRLEVNEALDNLRAAEKVVKARETSVEQAKEAMRLAQSGYEHGVNEQLDVLNAQVTLADSRLNYTLAVYDHNVSRVDLQRATGVLLDPIYSNSVQGTENTQAVK